MLDNVPPADWSLVENMELNISGIGIKDYKVFDDGPADWVLGPDAESKLFDLNMNENEEKERQYDFSLADFYLDIEKSEVKKISAPVFITQFDLDTKKKKRGNK